MTHDVIHVDFENSADKGTINITPTNEDLKVLEHIKYGQLDLLYPALKFYQGSNMNYLLENLALTAQNEKEAGLNPSQAFKREHHNGQIVRLAEQHAKPGFDFDALANKILEVTGKQTRYNHALNAKENTEERWAEEAEAAPKVVTLQNTGNLRASMK